MTTDDVHRRHCNNNLVSTTVMARNRKKPPPVMKTTRRIRRQQRVAGPLVYAMMCVICIICCILIPNALSALFLLNRDVEHGPLLLDQIVFGGTLSGKRSSVITASSTVYQKSRLSNNKPKTERQRTRHDFHDKIGDGNKQQLCLEQKCIIKEGRSLARAFPLRPKSNWILSKNSTTPRQRQRPHRYHDDEKRNNNMLRNHQRDDYHDSADKTTKDYFQHYGLMYVKVPKTGSSTAAGVALRIAKHYGVPVKYDHSLPIEQNYQNRHPTQSFMWASIRNPTDRAISYLSYTASRQESADEINGNFNDEPYILQLLQQLDSSGNIVKSEGRGGIQLTYTSLKPIPKNTAWRKSFPTLVSNPERVIDNVRNVLNGYDFFLVTDRMEESLVAMALLLDVDVSDILVFSSKQSGAGQYLPVQSGVDTHRHGGDFCCVPLHRIDMKDKQKVVDYLNSDEWYAMNYGDFVLHAAVSASLDKTISEVLGRSLFETALKEYRQLYDEVASDCLTNNSNSKQTQVYWPCSSEGKLQMQKASENCYHSDSGCGYRCIDEWLKSKHKTSAIREDHG